MKDICSTLKNNAMARLTLILSVWPFISDQEAGLQKESVAGAKVYCGEISLVLLSGNVDLRLSCLWESRSLENLRQLYVND